MQSVVVMYLIIYGTVVGQWVSVYFFQVVILIDFPSSKNPACEMAHLERDNRPREHRYLRRVIRTNVDFPLDFL